MKFAYGNFTTLLEKDVKFTSSLFEHFINTDPLKKDMTLQDVADSIRTFLKMENGEVELVIGSRYHKKEAKE